jgi:hypothetical protein
MVPFNHNRRLPLLPYEKQLIQDLGITPEEYSAFCDEVIWRSRQRPAEYDHIPMITAGPLVVAGALTAFGQVVVSVGVGLLFTAVSYLLTPKPASVNTKNRQLDSISGRDRFAPTYGFQVGQDLARYGEAIPIVFTRQESYGQGRYTGGVMISPKLVWSRLFSWGTYQTADLVFLVSQGRMSRGPYSTPADIAADRAGIYFGQTPLDALLDSDYRWFYYQGGEPNSNGIGYKDTSRLIGSHQRYGTLNDAVVLGATDNAFFAPTFAGTTAEGFSHAFSPSSQLRFGTYNAIPNGTPYRLNWEAVSRLGDMSKSSKRDATARRLQIAGNRAMAGIGRNHPRFVGILSYQKPGQAIVTTSFAGDNGQRIDGVEVGDEIVVHLSGGKLNEDVHAFKDAGFSQDDADAIKRASVKNTEINEALASDLEQFDDMLQEGSKFTVGNCLFRVKRRNNTGEIYERTETKEFTYTLVCEQVFSESGKGVVGICRRDRISNELPFEETSVGSKYDIGQAWFPLTMAEIASFQNTRECDYTEIGIRSQVWLRFSNFTNFKSTPGPAELKVLDNDDVQLRTGAIQTYSYRASFFALEVRPANASATDPWELLSKEPLCIRGNAPRDQFNFVRIGHPRGQYEFRLRPINAGELVQIIGRDKQCIVLNAIFSVFQRDDITTQNYGVFTIYARGSRKQISELATSAELRSPTKSVTKTAATATVGNTLMRGIVTGQSGDATARQISNAISKRLNKDADRDASEQSFPNIPWGGTAEGGTYVLTDSEAALFAIGTTNRGMKLKLTLETYQEAAPYTDNREWFWRIKSIKPIDVQGDSSNPFRDGEEFRLALQLIDGRAITLIFRYNVTKVSKVIAIDAERVFETNTAISEVSHYGSSITRSCDNNPEHEIVYVNESVGFRANLGAPASYEGCAMAGIKLRSSRNMDQLEQLHIYQKNGIQIRRYERVGNPPQTVETFGPSNIFTDLVIYLLTNRQAGLGELITDQLVDLNSMAQTAVYLKANRLFFDDVIVEPRNVRDFVASVAPSLLCNMVMRNGKFSIEPALPYHRNGDIATGLSLPKVPIKAIFTDGNIIEDSFEMKYLGAEERKPMKAAVRYRIESPNRFPEERTVVVSYKDPREWSNAPLEEFNFTHITSQEHAAKVARYFLSVRRNITHTVSFKTTPYGNYLAPGDYIRVVTKAGVYDPTVDNGMVLEDGTVVLAQTVNVNDAQSLPDNLAGYEVYLWERSNAGVQDARLVVDQGKAFNVSNAMFAIKNPAQKQFQVYVIESLQLDEDGLVQIVASLFPTNADDESLIAEEVTVTTNLFTEETA